MPRESPHAGRGPVLGIVYGKAMPATTTRAAGIPQRWLLPEWAEGNIKST